MAARKRPMKKAHNAGGRRRTKAAGASSRKAPPELARLCWQLEDCKRELKEALEQQKATAEILKIISESPTDTQPVFDAIVKSGLYLFGGQAMNLRLLKGDQLELTASTYLTGTGSARSLPLNDRSASGRAVLRREVAQIPDVLTEAWVGEQIKEQARLRRYRSALCAPLMREGNVIGTLAINRAAPGPFTEKEIALLKTFADQAVIAIENVRLFNETKEALEQQTATAEILKVISSSPTDVQPVFDAIAERAAILGGARFAYVSLFDGEWIHLRATHGEGAEEHRAHFPMRPGSDAAMTRVIRDRAPVQIEDVLADAEYAHKDTVRRTGFRSAFAVPMMRDGMAIGAIALARPEPGAVPEKLMHVLQTFADQAVIAIENVRLFKETKESLEQQTVISEILQVISSSPTDVQPVFDAIVKSGVHLFGGMNVSLRLVKGDTTETVASTLSLRDEGPIAYSLNDDGNPSSRAIRRREVVQVKDVFADDWVGEKFKQRAERRGHRSVMVAPMLRENKAIGTIAVTRAAPGSFTDKQVALLKTFADQAVIAIENVRLFNEIQEKSRQLEVASRHKSDFLAHMSHELRTPLNAIIGFSEALLARMFGEVNPKQDEYLRDIHTSGQHLLSLINDILDLAKVEAGRMELELSEFDLPTALRNAMTLVRERAQNHRIALELRVDEKLGAIRADERKVKQIVLNLLSNAVKFTPDGGKVDVQARPNGEAIEVSIRDTGAGIALEDQATLFEEFRQVGHQVAGKQEGTGLGLALTRRFVQLHGGTIRLESAPGKGSTFTFTLPFTAVSGKR